MKKILVIIGHQNIKYNSIKSLRGNTGTAGELEINIRVGDRVSAMLRERGFNVTQTDANGNDDKSITSQDFDLALSLHCDMDTASSGGMVGSGDKSVDNSWQESARIRDVFNEVYFKETGIRNKGFVTEGMTKWYMWRYLSSKTPCVLIEMGEAKDPHDSVLLGNTELIASAIVRSICKAFNVEYDKPAPTPEPPPVSESNDKKVIQTLEEKIEVLESLSQNLTTQVSDLTAKVTEKENLVVSKQSELDSANKLISKSDKQISDLMTQLEVMTSSKNQYKKWYEVAIGNTIDKYTSRQLISLGVKKLLKKK